MRKLVAFQTLAIVVLIMPGRDLPAIQTGNIITGTVFDTSGRPLPDLWVEVLDEMNQQLGRSRTDAVGRYVFSRLSAGVFLIRIGSDGIHVSQTERVEIVPSVGISGSHIQTVDFYLKSYSESTPTPSGSTGFLFAQEVPERARNVYQEAVELLSKDAEAGLKKLSEAITIFPDYYAARARYGVELVRSGKYEPAIPVLMKAVQINPKGLDSLYALGVAQYQLKKLPESAETLTSMIDLAPESSNVPYARYYLGMALVKSGKPGEAEPQLRKAYDLGRDKIPADAHMALAQIYGNSKRYKDAADQLELFLKEAGDARDKEKIEGLIKQLRAKVK